MQASKRRRGTTMVVALALTTAALAAPRGPAALADAAGKGGDFVPLSPSVQALDTRNGTGGLTGVRTAGSTSAFPVLGVGGIPAAGVSAVLVDVTAITPTVGTFLILWPDGAARPAVSTVNAQANQTISNSAVVPVGSDGKISVYNSAGNAHVAVDVQGYFTDTSGGAGGGFVPIDHTRLADTRSGLGGTAGAIASNGTRTFQLTGGVIAAGATAAMLDVIVVSAPVGGWLAAYPAGGSGSRSVMDFQIGTMSQGLSVQLSADGKASFTNHSTGAINLVVTGEGYFTASWATGAGLRGIAANRLVDTRGLGAAVPANGTIDVSVGGTNGLPTRGIAGALLNLTVVAPTSGGFLRAWPVGGAEGAVSLLNYPAAGTSRSSLAVVRPGTEGKIRIRNVSDGTAHFLVDLQAWFADPLPVLPTEQFSRVSVMQAAPPGTALGALEYAYVDNIGRVRFAHQPDVNNFGSVQWTPVADGPAFTGQPALSQPSGGQMQIAVQNRDSDVWTVTQTAAGGSWGAWSDQGGSMAARPVAANLSDGATVLFATDADGRLWHERQAAAGWRSLGDADLAGPVTVVPVDTGLRLFALDTTGNVKTAGYTTAGALSGWTGLGAAGSTGSPAAVVYPGYQVRLFVRAADGSIVTKMQDATGAWPAEWQSTGVFPAAGSPAAVLDPSGRSAVVARGADSEVYRVFETAQGSGAWGAWARISPDVSDPAASDPSVVPFVNSSGQTWLIAFRNINDTTRVYDRQVASGSAARRASAEFTGHSLATPPTKDSNR
jgi:hypothetical protein